MNHSGIFLAFAAIAVVAFVGAIAKRFNISGAIAFVVAGVFIGLIPIVPVIQVKPDIVLMLLLPPLLYSAGVGMSWRGLKSNAWTITSLAVGGVIFTAVGVAFILNTAFGIEWSIGLLLGAIIAPPDAVAPMAILRRFVLPSRLVTILEGEGLVNDATALILIGFAVAALQGDNFSMTDAIGRFFLIVFAEVVWGILVARLLLQLRKLAADPHVEIILSLMTPFVAFWVPEAVGGSGVLGAVSAGIYVSWNGPRYIAAATRLQGFFAWELVTYIIQATIFFSTGLQVRVIVETAAPGVWAHYLTVALVVSLAAVGLRFLWVFAGTFVPRLAARRLGFGSTTRWRYAAVISVTGVRGVVSLLAAMAMPELNGPNGIDYRSMILVVTLCVIIVSMLGVDVTLPYIVKRLGLSHEGHLEVAENRSREIAARVRAVDAVLENLAGLDREMWTAESLEELRRKHEDRKLFYRRVQSNREHGFSTTDYSEIQLALIDVERNVIARQFAAGQLDDHARRRIERELDLEDSRLHHIAKAVG